MRRRGFTLIEILVAMLFLTLALLSLIVMNQTSTRAAMDAYYEFTAFSLAMEPIEIFRGLGYGWLSECGKSIPPLPGLPVGKWVEVSDNPDGEIARPAEVAFFSRLIETESVTGEAALKGMKVTVTVRPAGQNRVAAWLSRDQVQISAILFERPP